MSLADVSMSPLGSGGRERLPNRCSLLLVLRRCRAEKRCFLCGGIRRVGLRYHSLTEVIAWTERLYNSSSDHASPPLPDIPSDYLTTFMQLCRALHFNHEAILTALAPRDEEGAYGDLLGSGKRAGVPVCWKDCGLAQHLLDFLRPPSAATPPLVIEDAPFDLGYMRYDSSLYEEMLVAKVKSVQQKLVHHGIFPALEALPEMEAFPSPDKYFRQRCRFSIQHDESSFEYMMWEDDGSPKHIIRTFPIASKYINDAMPVLKMGIIPHNILLHSLNSVHFIVSLTGNMIITLFYDVALDPINWREAAKSLKSFVENTLAGGIQSVQIVGRGACHSKVVVDSDCIEEVLVVEDGRELRYIQVLDGFSNPNAVVNAKSLNFMISVIKSIPGLGASTSPADRFDLLEMYCGMGNHTVALAQYTNRMVAVEINKHLCEAARINLKLNDITNAEVIIANSQDFARRVLRRKRYVSYSRTSLGEEYQFGAVVVDPPRCGLDPTTLAMIRAYEHIIYISCNPDALCRDLKVLCQTHEIRRLAVFDHFPYTPHIETGVYLVKRSPMIEKT